MGIMPALSKRLCTSLDSFHGSFTQSLTVALHQGSQSVEEAEKTKQTKTTTKGSRRKDRIRNPQGQCLVSKCHCYSLNIFICRRLTFVKVDRKFSHKKKFPCSSNVGEQLKSVFFSSLFFDINNFFLFIACLFFILLWVLAWSIR